MKRMLIGSICLIHLLLATAASAADKQIIFVVRHAERADAGSTDARSMSADPPLSAAGKARAERLAAMLGDAHVAHVFTTELRRTRETAAPLAAAVPVEPVAVPSKDVDGLVARVSAAKGASVVVGHSNTVPEILKKLGVSESIHIDDDEFGDLFVVVRGGPGDVTLVKLKY
jgi:phosphohistidine phosphatase SixA